MKPRPWYIRVFSRLKCRLGLHDWMETPDYKNPWCWNCGKGVNHEL